MEISPPKFLKDIEAGASLQIIVAPRAGRVAIVGVHEDRLKIAITSPPIEGRANEELIGFLSKLLRVPKSRISILKGHRSRHKSVGIEGLSSIQVAEIISPIPDRNYS